MSRKMVLGIGIDGVLRDTHSQFYRKYKKAFIFNEELIGMDENFNAVEDNMTEETIAHIEQLEKDKVHIPIDTYDLMNHFHFDSREDFEKFYYTDYAFEIFGAAQQYPRAMEYVNRLYDWGRMNNLFDIVLLSKESEKAVTSTYHFLAKTGCKIRTIKFVDEFVDKWKYCDVLIDDCPYVFESKPENKISIRINQEYNKWSDNADYSFNSINEVYKDEFLLKVFGKKEDGLKLEKEN